MSATDALHRSDVHSMLAEGRFRLAMPGGIARAVSLCASDNEARGVLAYVLLRVQHLADDRFMAVECVATDGKILGRWRDVEADASVETFDVFVAAKELLRLKLRWDSELQLAATGRVNSPDYGCDLSACRGSARETILGRITDEYTFPDYTQALPEYPVRADVGRSRFASKRMSQALKAIGCVAAPDREHGACYCVDQLSEDRPIRLFVPDGLRDGGTVDIYLMPMVVG